MKLTSPIRIHDNELTIDFNRISKVITIIDSRQERLQNLLVEILGKLGMDSKYRYLGYEPVTLKPEFSR